MFTRYFGSFSQDLSKMMGLNKTGKPSNLDSVSKPEDEEVNEYEFENEEELASFLWNAGSQERIKKIKSINKALNKWQPLHWLTINDDIVSLDKIEIYDNKAIKFSNWVDPRFPGPPRS